MESPAKAKHYKFFENRECEYFPCHETPDGQPFNCLFCYCPLYALGRKCGGAFRYTKDGIKDCSLCSFPHIPENYSKIMERFKEIVEIVKAQG